MISPESFAGKIALNLIDKLVVGLIATLVVMCFQQRTEDDRRLAERISSVAAIYTHLLIIELGHIQESMGSYQEVVLEAVPLTKVNPETATELSRRRAQLELAIEAADVVAPAVRPSGEALLEEMKKLNRSLRRGGQTEPQLRSQASAIREKYGRLLHDIQDALIKVAHKDFARASS